MLTPIVKQEGTTRTEKHLARIAEDAFFGLWSYPSVYRDEGIAKNGIGQEVADLLVLFGTDLIIFSDKDISFPKHIDIKVAWGRWYRAAIKDSAKQLFGAESFIRNHPGRLFLDKTCKISFPLPVNPDDLKIHLVAIARNSSFKSRKYFDEIMPGSSGSLMHAYFMNEKQALDNPFNVPDLNPNKTFIHVFDDFSLDLVLLHLETITDFINYLNEKESAVRGKRLSQLAGEEDFLAYYLNEITEKGFGKISSPPRMPKDFSFSIPELWWKSFFHSKMYREYEEFRKQARPWGKIVRDFSNAISTAQVGEGEDLHFLDHEIAVRVLASENLFSRARLSKALFEKYGEVPPGARSSRIVSSLSKPERLYVFLFFPWSKNYENYVEYRKERTACMNLYAHVARYKYPQAEEIIVFGTDTRGVEKSSETVIAFSAKEPMSDAEKDDAKKMIEEHGILRDTIEIKRKPRRKRLAR